MADQGERKIQILVDHEGNPDFNFLQYQWSSQLGLEHQHQDLRLQLCAPPPSSYTVSPQHKLTTRATSTVLPDLQLPEFVDRRNWTWDKESGFFHCDSVEKAVSNCDLLVWLGDIQRFLSYENQQENLALKAIEAHLREVLGQLQEVRGGIHNRPPRSTKAATALEAVQNATSQILVELDTLRGRQALAATIQVFQLLLFLG